MFAVKGQGGSRPVWPRRESRAAKGKVHILGVDPLKLTLSARLRLTEGAGRIHFPVTVGQEFFEQLNSEYLKTTYRRGRPERAWDRRKGRRAEAWDAAVYSLAAVFALQSHGVYVDVEAGKIEAMRQTGAVPAAGYQVYRSKFVTG